MRPFFDASFIVILGGVGVYFVRSAPFIEQPFKSWACYLVAAGTAYVALSQLGVLAHLGRTLGT